jgi:allantoicase
MPSESTPNLLAQYTNVADVRLGAVALFATDEFFAAKERMLQPGEPEWRAGVYDANGKWMDGWESRRRRDRGHDHCVVKLGAAARLAVLEIDTRHFTGNYPPFASVEACRVDDGGDPGPDTQWSVLLPQVAVAGNQQNFFQVQATHAWTHLKLNIFPDGGVARFRAYGTVQYDWSAAAKSIDLVAALHGGRAIACSDEHYGSMRNVLLPGRGTSMADGWETRRRREPGYDWVILRLGTRGRIRHVEIDTAHFKGNFPHQVSIQGAALVAEGDGHVVSQSLYWPTLLEPQYLRADSEHRFQGELRDVGPISHVRVNIHPDGGLSRVRLVGQPEQG